MNLRLIYEVLNNIEHSNNLHYELSYNFKKNTQNNNI